MGDETIVMIYFGVAFALGLGFSFQMGRTGDDDVSALVLLSFLWPAFVLAMFVFGPFYLIYRLGKAFR